MTPLIEMDNLFEEAILRRYRSGAVIFTEGDQYNYLYRRKEVMIKCVTVVQTNDDEFIVEIIKPGELFGLVEYISKSTMITSAICMKECQVECLKPLKHIPSVITLELAKKTRVLTEKISDFALLSVYQRVAKLINSLADENGVATRYTHQQMSDMIGSSREMVSILMKQLREGDFIVVDKDTITIKKPLPKTY